MLTKTLKYTLALILTTISAAVCGVNYKLEWIGSNEGLPQADVKSIATDGKGLLWISTNDGLARYDGKVFTPTAISKEGMPTIQARAVVSDHNGNIWVGSLGSGLFVYDTSVDRFVGVTSEVGYIYDIAVDSHNDAVWLAGRDGALHRITGSSSVIERLHSGEKIEQISHYTIGEISKKGNITQLTTDRSGALVALRNKSAYRYNSAIDNFEEYLPEVLQNVTCTAQYGDYTLFVRNKRLFSYGHTDGVVTNMNVDDVNRLHVSSRGELWIFCTDGVLLKELGTNDKTELRTNDGTAHGTGLKTGLGTAHETVRNRALTRDELQSPPRVISEERLQVLATTEDCEGRIWVGTLRQGMLSIGEDDRAFLHYNSGMNAETIYEDHNGAIFVGSVTGDLHIMNPDRSGSYATSRVGLNLSQASIFFVAENPYNDEYIIGRSGATATLNRDNMRHEIFGAQCDESHEIYSARALIADSTYLWVASYSNGLLRYDATTHQLLSHFTNETEELRLPSSTTRNLFKDSGDNLWIATSEGLVRITAKTRFSATPSYRVYRNDPSDSRSLTYNYTLPITEGSDGRIWVGTFCGGLNSLLLDGEGEIIENRRYTTENGLSNNSIKAVVIDGENVAWVTTNRGLNRIDPLSGTIDHYTPADGLQSYEFSELSGAKLSDGRIAFGGVNGLNIFDPQGVDFGENRIVRARATSQEEGLNRWFVALLVALTLTVVSLSVALYLRRKRSNEGRYGADNEGRYGAGNEGLNGAIYGGSTLTNGAMDADTATRDESPKLNEADQQFIDDIIAVIEANITDPTLGVERLCEALRMSKVTLNKRLKRVLNKTANTFIRSVRMQHAAKMLASGNYTIAETTYAIGLNDLRHFRECFKREIGVLPSEYITAQREPKSDKSPL